MINVKKHRDSFFLITTIMLLAVVLFNRAVTKIGIGGVYFLDFIFALNFFQIFLWVWNNKRDSIPLVLICGLGFSWLVFEYLSGDWGDNNIRRFAMAVYMVSPVLILVAGRQLYAFVYKYTLHVALGISIGVVVFSGEDIRPNISAMLLSFLFFYSYFVKKNITESALLLFLFVLVSFGILTGESSYRTPVVGWGGGLLFSSLYAFRFSKDRKIRDRSLIVLYCLFFSLFIAVLFFRDAPVVAQFISGVAGLFGIEFDTAGAETRERGDSSGTAETRAMFWGGIIEYALDNPLVFIFGNGHHLSFFERIFPISDFVDLELLEPHNSFIGFFYRYGILGFLLLMTWLANMTFLLKREGRFDALAVSSLVIALNYAFFEVALESPHGAFAFWFILMSSHFVVYEKLTKARE